MIGSRLGPYQLRQELGSGGMGKVYRAEVAGAVAGLDPGCAVALKVIHAHLLETPGFFKRFLREADIGATIQHENVVRTYDCDALLHDGTQQNFLVMEYVEGQTLRDLVQELERVPEELCRHIGREVAKGLTAIHEAGVVHRDLKPENVLITAEHEVKIMDLGVARLRDEAVRLSQTGAFVGSLEYAAPEQFRSADGEPDGRADLHALGVVLYELATGQHPYRDEDASRVIGRILNDQPRKAGEVNPQLSPFFEELVQTLLAKDREARFDTAAVLADVLSEGEASTWWKERAKALRLETKRPLRRIRIPRETALYGRDDDLSWLQAAYDKAKSGEGQVLLIEGEAGIGKTRLVDEFVGRLREAGEDLNFLFGSYPPGGAATASGAWSTAFREHLGDAGSAAYLEAASLLAPAFDALMRGEPAPEGEEPLTKDSLQTAFVHVTRALARERMTILLIEDLHFAPQEGRALFASLAMAVPGHRVLLVGTTRPELEDVWTASVMRLEHVDQRTLSRLGPKDLSLLLKDAFRSERLARELALQIGEKSDGNPFFAFEIIRGLRDGQFITKQPDGTWVTTRVIQEIQVPSSVMDLVQARIGDLDEEEKDLLDAASCCGFAFDPGLVAASLGMARLPALKRLGRIEKRHRLIRSTGRTYTFDHHQVQESLYAGIHEQMREEYHTALAEALEAREGGSDVDPSILGGGVCVELCEHFLKGGNGPCALRYLDHAMRHLEQGFMNEQALVLADRALAIPRMVEGAARFDLLLRKNLRLELLGRRAEQASTLQEAHALAVELGDLARAADADRAQGVLALLLWRIDDAHACIERYAAFAREHGDRMREMMATGNLGAVLHAQAKYEEALPVLERHRALSRQVGRADSEGRALLNRGHVLCRLGRYEEGIQSYEEARSTAAEAGDRVTEVKALGSLAGVLVSDGRSEEGVEGLTRYLALARELGDRSQESIALLNLGRALSSVGRYDEALARVNQCLGLGRELGDRRLLAMATGAVGHLEFRYGRMEGARAHLEEALQLSIELGIRDFETEFAGSLGSVFMQLGLHAEARRCFERQKTQAHALGIRVQEASALCGFAGLALNVGELTEAVDLAEKALAMYRGTGSGAGLMHALPTLAVLHWRGGESEAALAALDEALELAQRLGSREVISWILALRACLPGGDAAKALGALDGAEDGVNTMQARFFLWHATGEQEHLEEARRILKQLVGAAAEEHRASMLENVIDHREIESAWKALHPEETKRVDGHDDEERA